MTAPRADPDELLRRIEEREARARRGKLKVFLGAAPGVGKTYTMLETARQERAAGRDVVVGVVETHGRPETERLLDGLEVLPRRRVAYRGRTLLEFDLDAALRRRPALLLVDELAHTNAEGSRHPKRWQDVAELLGAGIDVWTTLNVQHLESLNDVVAQITHVRVRETVPDAALDGADEVEIVDLPPDDLLERLREGKVYIPDQAAMAADSFFRRGNLLALRELALRRTAEHVDSDVRAYRREHGIAATWPVAEHVLVCVGPSPVSASLVRAGRRMAAGLRAKWTVVTIESPSVKPMSPEDRARVTQHLRLAEQLGAGVVTLSGERASEVILGYARAQNVTRILIGKPTHPRWRDVLFGSLLDEVVRGSGEIEVHVTRGDPGGDKRSPPPPKPSRPTGAAPFAWAALAVAAATIVAGAMFRRFEMANLVMVYLLAIVFVAYRFGRRPALLASVLSVATFDFCFVPPHLTFDVADVRYLFTFAGMLLVGFVISGLTERIRNQAEVARVRERRTAALYALTRELAGARDRGAIVRVAEEHVAAAYATSASVLLPDDEGRLAPAGAPAPLDEHERSVAQWAAEHCEAAGHATATLPAASRLYVPLVAQGRAIGVLGVQAGSSGRLDDPEARQQLDALARQIAMALERVRLAEEAEGARTRAEQEELRNALLSSVSHDLRTPLAAITGAASTLLDDERVPADVRRELLQTVFEEADRLARLVTNLLDMTRLESGGLTPNQDWVPVEEVVGTALSRLEHLLEGRPVQLDLPADLPLVRMDAVLIVQVLLNLVENAIKYTPAGSPIEIRARAGAATATIEVADRGPGFPPGAEQRVFDKFFRAEDVRGERGAGLGLTICRGIVAAPGGTIVAENRPGGGALFRITLPNDGAPPAVPREPGSAREAATGEHPVA